MWTLPEEWGNILSLLALQFDFGVAGVTTGVLEETDWRDRLQAAGHLLLEKQYEEVFAKQKRPILISAEQTRLSISSQRFL